MLSFMAAAAKRVVGAKEIVCIGISHLVPNSLVGQHRVQLECCVNPRATLLLEVVSSSDLTL